MPSNEQDKPGGIRHDAPPPEGHAYAASDRPNPPAEGAAYAPPQREYGQDSGGDSRAAGDRASETVDRARERMGEAGEQARERMSDAGEQAREQAEHGREKSAEGMERAAAGVRDRMGDRDDMAGKAATAAADSMDRTAGYLKSHDNAEILHDVEAYIRDHPFQAMAGALAAGFVISRVLR